MGAFCGFIVWVRVRGLCNASGSGIGQWNESGERFPTDGLVQFIELRFGIHQIRGGNHGSLGRNVTLANGATGFTLPTTCGGASGNPMLIQFDSGAIWQAGYFAAAGSIVVDNLSNLIIDGTGATIQNTTNGSPTATCLSGAACSTQQPSKFLDAIACTNCEFRNLTVQDLYIHTGCEASSGCDTTISNTDAVGIHYGGDGLLITIIPFTMYPGYSTGTPAP